MAKPLQLNIFNHAESAWQDIEYWSDITLEKKSFQKLAIEMEKPTRRLDDNFDIKLYESSENHTSKFSY